MDAKKVEILLEAVESGSMMGIAGQNGYTPSGLSHLLRRLEAELGVQLVERTNRGIALSENGKRLLPYLRGYVESFETLEREAALLRNETETTLRLGAYASIAKTGCRHCCVLSAKRIHRFGWNWRFSAGRSCIAR